MHLDARYCAARMRKCDKTPLKLLHGRGTERGKRESACMCCQRELGSEGVRERVCVWVSGCVHQCVGLCHVPGSTRHTGHSFGWPLSARRGMRSPESATVGG